MDNISIASDFSIIADNSVNLDLSDEEEQPSSLDSSFMLASQMHGSTSTTTDSTQVEFLRIEDFGEIIGLRVAYSLSFTPKSSDRLALYREDFVSAHDFICSKWVNISEQQHRRHEIFLIEFEFGDMPENRECHYLISYLTNEGHIVGTSKPFQLSPLKNTIATDMRSFKPIEMSLSSLELTDSYRSEHSIEELQLANKILQTQVEGFKKKIEELQSHSADQKITVSLLEGIIEKDNQAIDQLRKDNEEFEQKVINLVLEVNDISLKVAEYEKEKIVTKERHSALKQDNEDLNRKVADMRQMIMEYESPFKETERRCRAAEKIAADLSSRLQTAKEEYSSVSLANIGLLKKLKKLKIQIASAEINAAAIEYSTAGAPSSTMSNYDNLFRACINHKFADDDDCDYDCDSDEKDDADKEGTFVKHELEKVEEESCESTSNSIHEAETQCDHNYCRRSACPSTCSHDTQRLSDIVNERMEVIVRQLTDQIDSLKKRISVTDGGSPEHSTKDTTLCNKQGSSAVQEEYFGNRQSLQEDHFGNRETHPTIAGGIETSHDDDRDRSCDADSFNQDSDDTEATYDNDAIYAPVDQRNREKTLYQECFLPQRTAPVFLPTDANCVVGCHSSGPKLPAEGCRGPANPSLPAEGCRGPANPSLPVEGCRGPAIPSLPAEGCRGPATSAGGSRDVLPPPLTPEETPSAIQASVLSHFAPETQDRKSESDDEDFHSAGENDQLRFMQCPMCSLVFLPTAQRLMDEHIESHLDHICPVCSMAFNKNAQAHFEEHVHGHFTDDEFPAADSSADPSGPWDRARSFHLLDID